MSNLYLILGYVKSIDKSSSGYTYYNNSNTQKKIAKRNVARDCAACTDL